MSDRLTHKTYDVSWRWCCGMRLWRKAHRQRLQLVGERRLDIGGRICDLDVGEGRERLLDQDLQLEARERSAQAEVAASRPERLVLGVACDVEAVRGLEATLVAVGRRGPHHPLLALADLLAAQLRVAGGRAGEVRERGEHAQRLLHHTRHQHWVLHDL